jgi:hypothetical protein
MVDMKPPQVLEIKQKMLHYQWYHTVELAPGVVTSGQYDLRPVLQHYGLPADLFGRAEGQRQEGLMREAIAEVEAALQTLDKPGPWSPDVKATDEFLDPLFKKYFAKLQLPLQLRKSDYHLLASLVPPDLLDHEVTGKLDAIVRVAKRAKPRTE